MGLVVLGHVGLPGSGIKPVSPALAGGFFTTEPLGKPCVISFLKHKQTLNFKHESSLSPQPGPLVGTNLPWTLAFLTSLLLCTSDLLYSQMTPKVAVVRGRKGKDRKGLI